MKTLSFTKEVRGGWYIDLPDWSGDKEDLAMVAGADLLLNVLAKQVPQRKKKNAGKQVVIQVSTAPIDGYHHLKLRELTPQTGGGIYIPSGDDRYPAQIWLCDVTRYVFGGIMPMDIYFEIVFKKDPYGIQKYNQIPNTK